MTTSQTATMEHRVRMAMGDLGAVDWSLVDVVPAEGDSFALSFTSPRAAAALVTVHAHCSDTELRKELREQLQLVDPV